MDIAVIILPFLLTALAAYLLGSISFSIVFTKLFQHTDVRKYGSGNAGATNVLRTAGKLPALLTLIFDFLKCVLSILIGIYIFSLYPVPFITPDNTIIRFIAGLSCILGHIYPLYFGFKGGKGVISSAALVLLIDWRLFVIGISVFIIMLAVTRIVSLSSITAVVSVPVATAVLQLIEHNSLIIANTFFAVLFAILVIYKHRSNIKRLLNGTEPKLGGAGKGA